MPRPLAVGQFLAVLTCLAVPEGSLAQVTPPGCSTGNLPVFTNAILGKTYPISNVSHGTRVQYVCNTGSFLRSTGSDILVCTAGSWTPQTDPCYRGCTKSTLPVFQYSEPENENLPDFYPTSINVRYRCKPGFVRRPGKSLFISCRMGTWLKRADPCHPGGITKTTTAKTTTKTTTAKTTTKTTKTPTAKTTTKTPTTKTTKTPTAKTTTASIAIISVTALFTSGTASVTSVIDSVRVTDFILEGVLMIPHAIITKGKKQKYKPGDRVTVECLPGYILNGDPVILYSGGNKWLPKIPSCTLSIFISIFVAGVTLGTVVLIFLVAYKNFHPQESSNITVVHFR